MSHIPPSIVKTAVIASERNGIPRSLLLGAPSVEPEELEHLFRRIPWERFCEFNDRVEAAWEKRGGLERYSRAFTASSPDLLTVARPLLTPAQFHRMVLALGHWVNPFIRSKVEELSERRYELRLELPESMRDSPSFLRICGSHLAMATTVLGLPPSKLWMEITPRRGHYVLELPPSKTLFSQAQDAAWQVTQRLLERIEHLHLEVQALQQKQCDRSGYARRRATELAAQWGLTPRQREVLLLLARGASNRELAATLQLAERTVEVHVTDLLRKSGKDSRARLVAAFWAEGD